MELPYQPTSRLSTMNAATPTCRLRYCGEKWLRLLRRSIRYVALRKVDMSAAKYSTSRRSMTPRAIVEKWVTGLSVWRTLASPVGSVTATWSSPADMRIRMKKKPRMKATIWLREMLDVNSPIATNDAARKRLPTYWATTAP